MPPLTGLTVVAPMRGSTALDGPAFACDEGFAPAPAPSTPPPSPRTLRTATALAQVISVLWTQVLTVFGKSEAADGQDDAPPEAEAPGSDATAASARALASPRPTPPPTAESLAAAYACHALPLPPPITEGRLTVVLDLDETLVAVYPSPAPASAGATSPRLTLTADYGDGSAGPVDVFVRPGLDAFLARLAALPVDVVLFTAGLPGYAGPIADALDPSGTLLPVRLYRPSTRPAGPVPHTKDLAILGRDLGRTVLLDNSPWSFLLQPGCGVPAAPFAGDGADTHLTAAVLPLLEALAGDPALDVRPALGARFGMAAWLAGRGGWCLYTAPDGHLAVAHDACACAGGGDGVGAPLGADGPEAGRCPAPEAAVPSLVCVEG